MATYIISMFGGKPPTTQVQDFHCDSICLFAKIHGKSHEKSQTEDGNLAKIMMGALTELTGNYRRLSEISKLSTEDYRSSPPKKLPKLN